MSTEVPEKNTMASKGGAEKKSKKRPREEEQAQAGDAKPAVEGGAESTPAKKQKKAKKDKAAAVKEELPEQPTSVTAVPEATPAKKDKKKKAKDAEAPTGNEENVKPEQTEQAGLDKATPAVLEPDQAKKSKKKKKKNAAPEAHETTQPTETPVPTTTTAPDLKPTATSTTATAIDEELLQSKSPFIQQTTSFYLALSPIAHHFPLEGLCAEHISPLLLTYYPPLKGVVLSYSNPRMSEHPEKGAQAATSKDAKVVLGRSIDEYAVTYIWLTADFLVFKPQRGAVMEGHVTLQNESILGLMCYNYFNAGVERSRIPKDWRWIEDESAEAEASMRRGKRGGAGHYVDGSGKKVEGRVVFQVKDFEATAGAESGAGSINIYGTLLGAKEDAKVDDEVAQKGLVRGRTARR